MATKTVERKICDITGQDIPEGFNLTITIQGSGKAENFTQVFNDVGPKAAKAVQQRIISLVKASVADKVVGDSAPVDAGEPGTQDNPVNVNA
jgi:hypothetical protein